MTIDEAINILKQYVDYDNPDVPDFYTMEEAIKVIIEALEQEPFINKPCISVGICEHDKNIVLDKIRAEIEEQVLESLSDGGDDWFTAEKVNECLEIIDKYRAEIK